MTIDKVKELAKVEDLDATQVRQALIENCCIIGCLAYVYKSPEAAVLMLDVGRMKWTLIHDGWDEETYLRLATAVMESNRKVKP